MESNFNNRDFEQFVKQNADQYRMFPSEKVWKGVNSVLHTRKKWYGFWLGVFLLMSGGAVTWIMTSYPSTDKAIGTPIINNHAVSQKVPKQAQEIDHLFTLDNRTVIADKAATVQEELFIPGFASPVLYEPQKFSDGNNHLLRPRHLTRLSIDNDFFASHAAPAFVLPQENLITEKSPGNY